MCVGHKRIGTTYDVLYRKVVITGRHVERDRKYLLRSEKCCAARRHHREAAARAASSQRQCNALSVASTQTVPTPRSHSNKYVDQRQSGSVKSRKSDLIAACDAVAQDVCEPIETGSSRPGPIIFLFHFSQKLKLNNDSNLCGIYSSLTI